MDLLKKTLIVVTLATIAAGCSNMLTTAGISLSGELRQWHKLTLTFTGPNSSETDSLNPFLDYSLNVTFTQGRVSYLIPGYYCANGEAGDTGASGGNKWRVHFAPPSTGRWNWQAEFRTGAGIAVSGEEGASTHFDGESGSFNVVASDKTGNDFRGKGLIKLASDKHYLQFSGTGQYWIKGGTDSPEDFLGCSDFDNTNTGNEAFPVTAYPDHVGDWKPGDPTWGNARGQGIIGALNYLGAQKVNSVYLLPMNLGGDGQNTHPFASTGSKLVYDCSKLDQWGMVFDHAQKNGILLQVVFNEAESANRSWLDGGTLGTERKLFYREMIARFAHVNGLNWMICEEHNPGFSTSTVKSFASYIRNTDPYDHPIGIHNLQGWPIKYHVQDVFDGFFGDSNFDYLSIQYRPAQYESATRYVDVISHLRNDGSSAGRPLALMFDELERARALDDESHDHSKGPTCLSGAQFLRKAVLWQIYLGGGSGVEWILEDLLSSHDFRPYEALWTYTRHALNFMDQIPVGDMVPGHHLLSGESKYIIPLYEIEGVVLTKPGEIYAVHLPNATSTGTLNLSGVSGTFTKSWYNPRTGSFQGEVKIVEAGANVPLGTPPSQATDDWVVLMKKSELPLNSKN
ncbi:MAG: DUF5060 domain-containing protein [Bacteroidetes bacterium]|nr:DUF5060 domain-containing protein [Bacteroidota bacterium]